jgi:curved DNA-binding protein CbpA
VLAHARYAKPTGPLRLPGITLDAPANEILGVSPLATRAEIQRAYRERMKIYHPDLIGRPGSREWQDAQKIAEAINRAKEEMLAGKK